MNTWATIANEYLSHLMRKRHRNAEPYRSKTAKQIQWWPIKGMRNLVAHSYGSMSRDIIWETAINDIPVLRDFCEEQLSSE